MISCPNCGRLPPDDLVIYSEALRKQTFRILPILPTCRHCGTEALISAEERCRGGRILVLTGTSGSGKSTCAELLSDRGWLVMDGDCVIQTVRHKKQEKQVDFREMTEEIARQIDILSLFGSKLALAHVVVPEEADRLIEIFTERNLHYRFILLQPSLAAAVERCQTRTCHGSVTPEYWVRHFYDQPVVGKTVEVIDNEGQTPEETVDQILRAESNFCQNNLCEPVIFPENGV